MRGTSVCGEAAADPDAAALLLGLGIRELSMSPASSAWVRERVRALDSRDAEARAMSALDGKGPDAVRIAVCPPVNFPPQHLLSASGQQTGTIN